MPHIFLYKVMKICLLMFGKSAKGAHSTLFREYAERLKHYVSFTVEEIAQATDTSAEMQRKKEGEILLKRIKPDDYLVLLDEKGSVFTSEAFARELARLQVQATGKRICFVQGGAYGFSAAVYKRANKKVSLSAFTLPHLLARVVFAEQLYRAFTILKGEKYHHG